MRAALLTGTGGPEMIDLRADVATPEPGPDEVLIRVRACGVNNTDLNTRIGWYGAGGWGGGLRFPRIQGADVCGQVAGVGAAVQRELLGHRVLVDPWIRACTGPDWRDHVSYLGSEVDGGFAEFCVVPAVNAHLVAGSFTDAELATFPCSWSTALHMLTRVNLAPGQRIAVPGASGGVGSALVQLAKLHGAHVTAVTTAAKVDRVRALGADVVLARGPADLVEAASADGGPFDVVADVVGGQDAPAWWRALRRGGRYVCSGAIAGPVVELDLPTMYLNDLEFFGATAYPPEVFARLMALITSRSVRPIVAATYPLEQIGAAQAAFAAKEHVGSIVITL
ncbi:MAG: zinc-binding dehydrogenase [Candidatus Nanopelagicales bacterium]